MAAQVAPMGGADDHHTCSICLEAPARSVRPSSCAHTFCRRCLMDWAAVTNLCPLCKSRFTHIVQGGVRIRVQHREQAESRAEDVGDDGEFDDDGLAEAAAAHDEFGDSDEFNAYDLQDGFLVNEDAVAPRRQRLIRRSTSMRVRAARSAEQAPPAAARLPRTASSTQHRRRRHVLSESSSSSSDDDDDADDGRHAVQHGPGAVLVPETPPRRAPASHNNHRPVPGVSPVPESPDISRQRSQWFDDSGSSNNSGPRRRGPIPRVSIVAQFAERMARYGPI
ncbi:unnamed protein product (mitochondrion) [Plasmodiophora brassicae]|uniref:RING-type domain-containing protein n=1 Tax=Plasmodiophora brassicae TaxID=37360 RepID=A0A0G4IMN8_PLABS|nr:hypothetical protein PBRA_005109 [Plasmodiophora brassicae]SPQ94558.1 unnamed protein product [Plasmodiophora brassicae]